MKMTTGTRWSLTRKVTERASTIFTNDLRVGHPSLEVNFTTNEN